MLDQLILSLCYLVLVGCWLSPAVGVLLPVWLNLVLTATCVVFIGSHRSLGQLVTDEPGKDGKSAGGGGGKKDTMSTKDVMQFPIVGSCALFGLFIAFKYYKVYAAKILSFYFAAVGLFTLTVTLTPLTTVVFKSPKKFGFKRTFPLIGELDLEFTIAELISSIPAGLFAYYHFIHKGAMMNNVLGISFCVQAIKDISLGNYRNATILLGGLFVYDIFWVFYSESFFGDNVMVSVAQNLDEPIKLLFPMSLPGNESFVASEMKKTLAQTTNSTFVKLHSVLSGSGSECMGILNKAKTALKGDSAVAALQLIKESRLLEPREYQVNCTKAISSLLFPLKDVVEGKHSLLGLGDIVIPGLFVAFLHRFDAIVGKVALGAKLIAQPIPDFVRTYFYTSVVFYALGLGATLWGMQKCGEWFPDNKSKCAQPALLYLVPACMLASLIVSLARGQFYELLKYDEEEAETKKDDDKKK